MKNNERFMRTTRRRQPKGQALVFVALLMPTLIGATSLAIDVGVFYGNYRQLQRTADAAVLAGANYLPFDPATAKTVAANYAQLNGVPASEIVGTSVAPDDLSISIQLKRTVAYTFGRVFGLTSAPVAVKASAGVQGTGGVANSMPIGVDYRATLTPDTLLTIKGQSFAPGNWAPLALGGSGASVYSGSLAGGYRGLVSVGDYVSTETGNMVGPTRSGIDARLAAGLAQDPTATFATHNPFDPRVVTLPIVDFSGINGNSQVPVKGFVVMWVVGFNSSGDLQAYVINQVASAGRADPKAPGFGAYTPILLN